MRSSALLKTPAQVLELLAARFVTPSVDAHRRARITHHACQWRSNKASGSRSISATRHLPPFLRPAIRAPQKSLLAAFYSSFFLLRQLAALRVT